jgi:hypothetical protein
MSCASPANLLFVRPGDIHEVLSRRSGARIVEPRRRGSAHDWVELLHPLLDELANDVRFRRAQPPEPALA